MKKTNLRQVTIAAALLCTVMGRAQSEFNVEQAVKDCDVKRTTYTPKQVSIVKDSETKTYEGSLVNLYQGNGEMGCSYGPLGLHLHTDYTNTYGETKLLNLNHRVRARHNHDYLVPLLQVYWENVPASVTDYKQQQSFYDGTIDTEFTNDGTYKVKTWFDPTEQNLGFITINASKAGRVVMIDPMDNPKAHYDQKMVQQVSITNLVQGVYKVTINCNQYEYNGSKDCSISKESYVYVYTNANVEVVNDKDLKLILKQGDNDICISYGMASTTSAATSLQHTKDWWHNKWNTMGMIGISDGNAMKMWVRSMAMFLSSYDDQENGLCPPMGFTGTDWSFSYPQDVSYVHPIFVATGNMNIAQAWIKKWASEIEGQRAYTQRIYKQNGVMIPWVYPYNGFDNYHEGGWPGHTYGQIHQGAYYVRMAAEVANVLQNDTWTQNYFIPVLTGVAEFYGNIASKHEDGLWHFYSNPSCGQDEFGDDNQTDYIDVLYAAQYVLSEAVKRGIYGTNNRYQQILDDGIAFPALLNPTGSYYYAFLGGSDTWGNQKHPAQLNELLYDPCYTHPTDPAVFVYLNRNDMTTRANEPYYWGWTLGAFLLAGSRLGLIDEWKADWANMSRSNYVDSEWIQSFETSKRWNFTYYNINNGLICQSLLNNLVCDWFGRLEIAKCNPWEGMQYIRNITSQLGVTVNGTVEGQQYNVTLTAWKDCSFKLYDQQVTLTKDQSITISGTAPTVEYDITEPALPTVLENGEELMLEAEDATLSGDAKTADDNGCSGGKRVGYIGEAEANTVTFNFNAEVDGKYTLTFYYMTSQDRRFEVTVNDANPFFTEKVNSGGWTGVKRLSFSTEVVLKRGKNTIVLGNTAKEEGNDKIEAAPNLDCITLQLKEKITPETQTITISSYKQATYSSPYALDFTSSQLRAYVASGYNHSTGKILLTRVYEVSANTGIVVLGSQGKYEVPTKVSSDWNYHNMLVATVNAKTVNATDDGYSNYYLSDGSNGFRFYTCGDGKEIPSNRAYLRISTDWVGENGEAARMLDYRFDDEATGIGVALTNSEGMDSGQTFDLQGRRVKAAQKGVYISNGKKKVIK